MCLGLPEVVMIDLWHPNYHSHMIIVGIYHIILSCLMKACHVPQECQPDPGEGVSRPLVHYLH